MNSNRGLCWLYMYMYIIFSALGDCVTLVEVCWYTAELKLAVHVQ